MITKYHKNGEITYWGWRWSPPNTITWEKRKSKLGITFKLGDKMEIINGKLTKAE